MEINRYCGRAIGCEDLVWHYGTPIAIDGKLFIITGSVDVDGHFELNKAVAVIPETLGGFVNSFNKNEGLETTHFLLYQGDMILTNNELGEEVTGIITWDEYDAEWVVEFELQNKTCWRDLAVHLEANGIIGILGTIHDSLLQNQNVVSC